MICFNRGPAYRPDFSEFVEKCWDKKAAFMNNLGLYKNDPKLPSDSIPVGYLEEKPEELKRRIFGITEILKVHTEE
jgi:hypothetical protein